LKPNFGLTLEDGGALVGEDETVDVAVAPGRFGVALELGRRRLVHDWTEEDCYGVTHRKRHKKARDIKLSSRRTITKN